MIFIYGATCLIPIFLSWHTFIEILGENWKKEPPDKWGLIDLIHQPTVGLNKYPTRWCIWTEAIQWQHWWCRIIGQCIHSVFFEEQKRKLCRWKVCILSRSYIYTIRKLQDPPNILIHFFFITLTILAFMITLTFTIKRLLLIAKGKRMGQKQGNEFGDQKIVSKDLSNHRRNVKSSCHCAKSKRNLSLAVKFV